MYFRFKTALAALLTLATLTAALPVTASAYDNSVEFDISGFDCKTDSGSIFVYPNDGNEVRAIKADEFNFRYTKIMIFDREGMLIEAGGDLYANSTTVTGSPQEYIYVPAGGFAVAFKPGAVPNLKKCFDTAMEGAMLYNATMSVIYPVKGEYTENKLKIEYDNKKAAPSDAKKFLFVGNSSTYFNGTPIKFKALATAAGETVHVEYCTYGSAYLSEFANETHERGIALRSKLKVRKYDYVVLQDAGGATYNESRPAVETILPFIEENGAEALLYMRYSGEKVAENRINGAKTHYENYTKLASDFSLNCAPAALAFLICTEKYPDIDLYADDNSHHSKEGSYLVACVWLKSYLGIDPRGNSYTAQMDADIAAKLQECAVIACEEGYSFAEEKDTYTDKNGDIYENIAVGKTYTATGEPYTTESWTDTGADGKPLGKLTDGVTAKSGDDGAIGCYKNAGHTVTIDLGNISQLRAIKTDLFGNDSWGITDPKDAKIQIAVSNDGVNFTELGEAEMSDEKTSEDWKRRDFTLEPGTPVMARFVRVTYLGGKFNWSSEIHVYGTEAEAPEEISETPAEESQPETDYQEPESKNYQWAYWLIGAVAVAIVIIAAVIIAKKNK